MNYLDIEANNTNASIVPEIEQPEFNTFKPAILAAVALGAVVFHPKTHFEEGAEEDILEHKEGGGSFLILMTHYNRVEPALMLPLAARHKALKHIRYNTGVTARAELWKYPGLKLLLNSINAVGVTRSTERPYETKLERLARQDDNQKKQAVAGRYLAAGQNWIIWPEGSSRQSIIENGVPRRVDRDGKTLLPIRKGFVYSLESMSEEERQKVRLLIIASHFGQRTLGILRPTIYVRKPAKPIEGPTDIVLMQGEELMRDAVEKVVALDGQRKR